MTMRTFAGGGRSGEEWGTHGAIPPIVGDLTRHTAGIRPGGVRRIATDHPINCGRDYTPCSTDGPACGAARRARGVQTERPEAKQKSRFQYEAAGAWFWAHVAQVVIGAMLAIFAFR